MAFYRSTRSIQGEVKSISSGGISSFLYNDLKDLPHCILTEVVENLVDLSFDEPSLSINLNSKTSKEEYRTEITCKSYEEFKRTVIVLIHYLPAKPDPFAELMKIPQEVYPLKYKEEKRKGKTPYYNKNRPF